MSVMIYSRKFWEYSWTQTWQPFPFICTKCLGHSQMINMQSSGSLHLSPLAFQTLQQLIELKTLHALPGQHKKHAKLPINFCSYVLISAVRNFSLLQSPDYRLEQRIIFDRRDRPQWVRYEEKLVVLVVITKCAIFSRDITACTALWWSGSGQYKRSPLFLAAGRGWWPGYSNIRDSLFGLAGPEHEDRPTTRLAVWPNRSMNWIIGKKNSTKVSSSSSSSSEKGDFYFIKDTSSVVSFRVLNNQSESKCMHVSSSELWFKQAGKVWQ